MHKLRLSVAAGCDLDDIQDNGLIAFGLSATRKHMPGFEKVFATLRRHPHAGQRREEYGAGVRAFPHPPHRRLYRVKDGEVLIVRVLHTSPRPSLLRDLH